MKKYIENIKHVKCSKFTILLFLFVAFACKTTNTGSKNRSIGAPGELLIVMDDMLQKTAVRETLKEFANTDFPCIPQSEPTFRVTCIAPSVFKGHFKAYRNILVVSLNGEQVPTVGYESDVWANCQRIVQITCKGVKSFTELFSDNRSQIFEFLYRGDIETMAKANMKGANKDAQNFLLYKYNIKMTVPDGYQMVKDTLGFTWFRTDKLETIESVIIHQFDLDSVKYLNTHDLIALRNHVGKEFVPGPSQGTFMTTEQNLPVVCNRLIMGDKDVVEVRGIWKVNSYFMGGPFVNYFIKDEENNKLIMVEGFVYAPKKRNKAYYVRKMESILYSLKINT